MSITLHSETETTILKALQQQGVAFPSSLCGGHGTCGKCKVKLADGTVCLACNTIFSGNLTLDMEEGKGIHICSSITDSTPEEHEDMENAYGFALDIGTTTVVLALVSLKTGKLLGHEAQLNAQSSYGADVISRIQYTESVPSGTETLQKVIVDQIDRMGVTLVDRFSIASGAVLRMVVSANTTMLHFLLGKESGTIAVAPFTPLFLDSQTVPGKAIGMTHFPSLEITTIGGISSYVGADITSGLAVLDILREQRPTLFLDLGTNGEMALWTGDVLYCCSTAAGPVFEGASICYGTGSVEGAICHLDRHGFETIGNKPPVGICGSGVIDVTALLRAIGKIDETGYMEQDFSINDYYQTKGDEIAFTPKDVREVQLAKSAIFSGIEVMMEKAGLEEGQINLVMLAGGFGTYLSAESAMAIGLISPAWKGKTKAVGNTSLSGAVMALTHEDGLSRMEAIRKGACYIELSGMKEFQELFIENMCFA